MRLVNFSAAAVLGAMMLAACAAPSASTASGSSAIRSITTDEALADFDQIAQSFRALYGALDRKEQRYAFDFESIVRDYRARVATTQSEAEAMGVFQEFISRFQDAHVSLQAELQADQAHQLRLPFDVMPVEDTFVVYASTVDGIKVGDELVALDGVSARDLTASYMKYVGTPNPLASAHMASAKLTNRPTYLTAGIAAGATAKVRLRAAGGTEREVDATWSETQPAFSGAAIVPQAGASTRETVMSWSASATDVIRAEFAKEGARVPFFMTDAVRAALGVTEVAPSAAALAKFGLTTEDAAAVNYFAAVYPLQGKKVLLFRLPSYVPVDVDKALKYMRALFDEQQPQVDALVYDETHNPGGANIFANGIMAMLTSRTINANVEEVHADRKWIQSYVDIAAQVNAAAPDVATAFTKDAHVIDEAYSSRQPRSAPIPLFEPTTFIDPDPEVHWSKPLLVLADELSVSNADIVPNVLKVNHVAPIFGQRTMGGGGNVEVVATLTNTQAQLHLSRGLFTVYDPSGVYPENTFIEDNGVLPDIAYSHTLADFRVGYVGYVSAFNAALATQLSR